MGLKRGDVVIVALQGDIGKPRPAVVIETDRLVPTNFVMLCPGTSELLADTYPRRILVEPTPGNGLKVATQFQADKITTTRRAKIGNVVGQLDAATMEALNGVLFVMTGLAD